MRAARSNRDKAPAGPLRRARPLTLLLTTLLSMTLLAGCGSRADDKVRVQPSDPAASPYSGPLYVPPPSPGAVDENGESVWSPGASGAVVQCRTEVVGSSDWQDKHAGEVGSTLEKGLRESRSEGWVEGPIDDFRINRDDGERVLLTRTYEGRIIQATVMRDGASIDGTLGWYAESSARCDWSEFPEQDHPDGLQLWTDAGGGPVSTRVLVSWPGPSHCHWQSMTFLALSGGQLDGGTSYVRGHHGELDEYFDEPYVARTTLPADAVDSGYRREGKTLWFSADRMRAYVGSNPGDVELWPRITKTLGCA